MEDLYRNMSFKECCKYYGADYEDARRNKRKYKNLSDHKIVEITIKNQEELLRARLLNEYCREHNIGRHLSYKVRQQYKGASIDKLIEIIDSRVNNKGIHVNTFKYKCEKIGIDYNTAKGYKRLHPELTDEQVLYYYIQKYKLNNMKDKKLGFKDMCTKLNIHYKSAWRYKKQHPELTVEQIIINFKHDCYINLFGELIIPD